MIGSKLRFHGHGSLRYLYKNSDAVRSRLFTLRIITNPHRKSSRFAIVVSKKVHKSAVGRNRIRRRTYEIVRQEQPFFNKTCDAALIVTNSEVLSISHDELVTMIRELFVQAGVSTRQ